MVKKLFPFFLVFILSISMFAQVPDAFNYQAVIRNSSGEILPDQNISLRISILDGSATGTNVFTETHSETTSNLGLVAVNIGKGILESGDFSTINWSTGDKFLKIEIDEDGGSTYTDLGAVELLSIPYAFYANDVLNKDDADADPSNEVQDILLVGTDLTITSGSTIDLSILQDGVDDADADATNEIQDLDLTSNVLTITNHASPTEIDLAPYQGTNTDEQTLSLTGTDLSISGGNTVDVSPIQDGVDDADNDPTNEYQILSISNDTIYLENGGYAKLPVDNIDDADSDPGNEYQNLLLVGDTLKIESGNQVVFSYDTSQWINNGNKLYYNTGNVGVGSTDPASKLEVRSVATSGALFQVINANNDTVFAVYPDGVKVFVDPDAKGKVGGFAISGKSPNKAGEIDYMRVTSDSTRIYVNEPASGKGKVGGFAISGRSPSKGVVHDYLVVTNDSTRIYVNDTATLKGKVGGFAISGRSPNKGTLNDYLKVTRDSTRIYITEDAGKGKVGGFAISGRSPNKGITSKFMDMTKENYFIGHESGQKTTEGKYNSFIGYRTGYNNTDGNYNTFLGDSSGLGNTMGSGNLFVGKNSGISNSTGSYNSFIGYKSGYSNTDGLNNSFLGSLAGYSNTSGSYNTFAGDSAGYGSTTGDNNSFFGNKAGYNNYYGENNVFVGNQCGYSSRGNSNVFIGNFAGYSNDNGNYNIFIGDYAGYLSDSRDYNTFIGSYSGYYNTTGGNNVFIGDQAGMMNTSGGFNVFQGCNTGQSNTAGSENVFQGFQAGHNNTKGSYNVFLGALAGYRNQTANYNVAVGRNALYQQNYSNSDNDWNSANTAIGSNALYNNKSTSVSNGFRNTALGYNALYANTTGYNNTAVGYSALSSGTAYENSTALGYDAEPQASNTIRLGNASVTTIGGYADWTNVSDERFKTNIQENVQGIDFIMKLRPVTYNLNMEAIAKFNNTPDSLRISNSEKSKEGELQIGFLAQEVEAAANELGFDFHGVDKPKNKNSHYGLRYAEFVVPLVKAVQEQQQIIEEQKNKISGLENRLAEIEKLLQKD